MYFWCKNRYINFCDFVPPINLYSILMRSFTWHEIPDSRFSTVKTGKNKLSSLCVFFWAKFVLDGITLYLIAQFFPWCVAAECIVNAIFIKQHKNPLILLLDGHNILLDWLCLLLTKEGWNDLYHWTLTWMISLLCSGNEILVHFGLKPMSCCTISVNADWQKCQLF